MSLLSQLSVQIFPNQLHTLQRRTSAATAKLSSGLRINQAADDAAGLSISEKMRGQIRGLAQAQRNVQDGISLLQVADGALGQIAEPSLQRMRELMVQAGNGTLTSDDRAAIQAEIDQIMQHIDAVANETTFNGIPLLNVPAPTPPRAGAPVFVRDGSEAPLTSGGRYDTAPSWGGGKIVFATDLAMGGITVMDEDGSNLQTLPLTGYAPSVSPDGTKIAYFDLAGSTPPASGNLFVAGIDGSAPVQLTFDGKAAPGTDLYPSTPSWSADGQSLVFAHENGIYRYDFAASTQTAVVTALPGETLSGPSLSPDGSRVVYQNQNEEIFLTDSFGTRKLTDGIEPKFSPDGRWIAFTDSSDASMTQPDTSDIMVIRPDGTGLSNLTENMSTAGLHYHNHHPAWSPDGTRIVFHTDGMGGLGGGDFGDLWTVEVGGLDWDPDARPPSDALLLQVGANEGQQFRIALTDARTAALGLAALTVDPPVAPSLDRVDAALKRVSEERSRFGAYANALEHIRRNISNAEENQTSARSRIADADMAKEMMEMTKANILSQAVQATMAQANQRASSVLQLLQTN